MTTTYGTTTIAARTHLPIHTKPIRIPGRPAPDLSPDRWAIRSPWAGMTPDPAAERAALKKIAKQQQAAARVGRGNANHFARHVAAARADRDHRLTTTPPDQWSDRPLHLTPDRAATARALADTIATGTTLADAATTAGVPRSTAEKWLVRGWTTQAPDPNRGARVHVQPMDPATRAAVEHAAQLIAQGMGRRQAAATTGAPLRRLRAHLGAHDTGHTARVDHAARLVAEGMSRENAAKTAGCTRQSLRKRLGPATKDAAA